MPKNFEPVIVIRVHPAWAIAAALAQFGARSLTKLSLACVKRAAIAQ